MRLLFLGSAAVLAALAVLACLASRHLPHLIHGRIQAAIREQIVWQQSSPPSVQRRYSRDNHPGDTPVYLRLYLFNITNLPEVQKGAKPVLAELGPYTYAKHRVKRHVWFNVDGRVRYKEYAFHVPLPHLSNGSLDDLVTTLNIPLVGALEVLGGLASGDAAQWLQLLVSLIESWQDPRFKGLFTTRSVRELLWGYEDPLLARLAPFVRGVDATFQLLHNMSAPREADGAYATQVNTGLHNISEVWQYEEWENVTRITSWSPPHVEHVRGTDAFQFRPGLALGSIVEVWVGELYRAARLLANEKVMLGGRVPALRFRADPQQGDPDPRYFQYIQGLMNITSPRAAGASGEPGKPGPPLFLSYPHYCQADERLEQGVVGISCDPPKHDLFLDVEPLTGITLRASKRLMLSSWFGSKWRSIEPAVRDTFLPIFWAEEASEASAKQLSQFRPLMRAQAMATALGKYALPAGIITAVLAAACVFAAFWRRQDRDAAIEAGGEQHGSVPGAEEDMEFGSQDVQTWQQTQQEQPKSGGAAVESWPLLTDAYLAGST